ncbi:MAG: hypothetical protein RIT03_552 [Bacteroidota bacterium]|jgi:hypothetical protein
MKKILVISSLLLSFLSYAQLREKGTTELIPVIGSASSNYYGQTNLSNEPLSSVNLGVQGDYFYSNRWSLRSGLLFQKMGSQFGGFFKEELNYISIPVNANWHFGSTRKWNLNFGPTFGLLTAANSNGVDIKSDLNGFQYGLQVGIGYKLQLSEKFSILLDYQSMSGLSKVSKDSQNQLKNSYGSFDLGAVFKL